jgi:hypothetical protein
MSYANDLVPIDLWLGWRVGMDRPEGVRVDELDATCAAIKVQHDVGLDL